MLNGGCWGQRRLTGETRNVTLRKHSDSCTVYGGVAKKWNKADSIKEQEQVTEKQTSVMSYYWLGSRLRELHYICQSTFSDERNVLKGHAAAGYKQEESSTGQTWGKQADFTVTFSKLSGNWCGNFPTLRTLNVVCRSQKAQSQDVRMNRDFKTPSVLKRLC